MAVLLSHKEPLGKASGFFTAILPKREQTFSPKTKKIIAVACLAVLPRRGFRGSAKPRCLNRLRGRARLRPPHTFPRCHTPSSLSSSHLFRGSGNVRGPRARSLASWAQNHGRVGKRCFRRTRKPGRCPVLARQRASRGLNVPHHPKLPHFVREFGDPGSVPALRLFF